MMVNRDVDRLNRGRHDKADADPFVYRVNFDNFAATFERQTAFLNVLRNFLWMSTP